MKNMIAYYYNLYSYDIHQSNDNYKFQVDGVNYILSPCDISSIKNAYNLSIKLIKNGVYVHEIVPTVSNEIYIIMNNKSYVLIKKHLYIEEKIGIEDINKFNSYMLNIQVEKNNDQNWGILWSSKIDYFEYQINQFGKRYPIIRESVSYYIGLAETGISLYMSMTENNAQYGIVHRRIKTNSTVSDLYDPLNLVTDYKIRDAAEYYKDLFLIEDNILDKIINYFINNQLSSDDCYMFFVRMFYPSFYFDVYEQIIAGKLEESKIKNIIEKTKSYESLLSELYSFLSNYRSMPDIEWLKKTMNHNP